MPRATASTAAVELTVTRPCAVSSARAIGPVVDDEVLGQRGTARQSREQIAIVVDFAMGLLLARRRPQLHDHAARRIGLAPPPRGSRPPADARDAPAGRSPAPRTPDRHHPTPAARAATAANGRRASAEALRQPPERRERRELAHLARRVQHEQVALCPEQQRATGRRDRDPGKPRDDHRSRRQLRGRAREHPRQRSARGHEHRVGPERRELVRERARTPPVAPDRRAAPPRRAPLAAATR